MRKKRKPRYEDEITPAMKRPGSGYSASVKKRARELYLFHRLPAQRVADIIKAELNYPVKAGTIINWAERNGWRNIVKTMDGLENSTPAKLLKTFDTLLDSIIADKEADPSKLNLVLRMSDKLGLLDWRDNSDYSPEHAFMENFEFILGYLKKNDPDALAVMRKHFGGLIQAFKERAFV